MEFSIIDPWFEPLSDWKEIYVIESNRIDPQPGYMGNHRGCKMFDNHMNALNFALTDDFELKQSTPLDIHRFLTKDIPYFENQGMSGKYRTCSVYIGGYECPKFNLIPHHMSNWFFCTKNWIETAVNYETAIKAAWASHNMFEVIHPFIDGNGRTGRLLYNKIMVEMGYDPVIFFYENVEAYYNYIENFRNLYWTGHNFDFSSLQLS